MKCKFVIWQPVPYSPKVLYTFKFGERDIPWANCLTFTSDELENNFIRYSVVTDKNLRTAYETFIRRMNIV